jgi:hypothetical protein
MCEQKISSYVCGRVFNKKMCARIKHGRISMTKPLEFCFKLLFLSNPSLDLC